MCACVVPVWGAHPAAGHVCARIAASRAAACALPGGTHSATCSTQHSTAWRSTARRSTAQHDAAQHSMTQHRVRGERAANADVPGWLLPNRQHANNPPNPPTHSSSPPERTGWQPLTYPVGGGSSSVSTPGLICLRAASSSFHVSRDTLAASAQAPSLPLLAADEALLSS
jgi:hypothetical protein